MLVRPGGARLHDFWQQASKRSVRKFQTDNFKRSVPDGLLHLFKMGQLVAKRKIYNIKSTELGELETRRRTSMTMWRRAAQHVPKAGLETALDPKLAQAFSRR